MIEGQMQGESLIDFIRRKLNTAYSRRQSQLAEEIGVNQSTVSRIARGETLPKIDVAQKLLDRFAEDERKAKLYRSKSRDRRKGDRRAPEHAYMAGQGESDE